VSPGIISTCYIPVNELIFMFRSFSPFEKGPLSPRFRGEHALRRYPTGEERCIGQFQSSQLALCGSLNLLRLLD
jgi:hypothetical protein